MNRDESQVVDTASVTKRVYLHKVVQALFIQHECPCLIFLEEKGSSFKIITEIEKHVIAFHTHYFVEGEINLNPFNLHLFLEGSIRIF